AVRSDGLFVLYRRCISKPGLVGVGAKFRWAGSPKILLQGIVRPDRLQLIPVRAEKCRQMFPPVFTFRKFLRPDNGGACTSDIALGPECLGK
ncbi:MAG: hypothetical protein J0I13_03560, partial [Rhizobiales bacterium]|nr:hypothetical protein [Hyphomicrobiales bacterium]